MIVFLFIGAHFQFLSRVSCLPEMAKSSSGEEPRKTNGAPFSVARVPCGRGLERDVSLGH